MFNKLCFSLLLLALSASASAVSYSYVDWTAMDIVAGTASGTITLNDGQVINVQLTSTIALGDQSQMGAGTDTNYWTGFDATYTTATIQNAPTLTDLIVPNNASTSTITITFSQPVSSLVMDLLSAGSTATSVTYTFDQSYALVNQGPGYFGNGALTQVDATTLQGNEGNGVIRFPGTFTSLSITATAESWNGFTIGIANPPAVVPANTPMGLLFMALLFAGFGLYYRRKLSA